MGDRVKYNKQEGCVALIGCSPTSGCAAVRRKDWSMNRSQVLILFDNGARLVLDNVSEDQHLVLCRRRGEH